MAFNLPNFEYHRYQRYFTDISRLYQKKEVKVYTELILTFATIAFFAFFAIKPAVITLASLLQERSMQKQILDQLDTKINSLTKAQQNYNQLTQTALVEEALPKESALDQVIYNLEYLILQDGISLNSISFQPIVLKGTPKEAVVGFSLSTSGSMESLNKLLASLNNLRREITIQSASFTKSQKEQSGENKENKSIQEISLSVNGLANFFLNNP